MTPRKLLMATFTLVASGSLSLAFDDSPHSGKEQSDSLATVTAQGRLFLANLLDPELDLVPEYRGANVYWLYHDNYLAAKILSESHPQIARSIRAAIKREGVRESGKIELLFGELKNPLPFRQFQLKDVRTVARKVIRTEVVLSEPVAGWENYADFLLMACIAETDRDAAGRHWNAAIKMWDGIGFVDAATRQLHRYSTYKLALGLIAADKRKVSPPAGMRERLLSLQAESGGWITDYDATGRKIGLANVETTCLAILGLESK